MYKRVLLKLSGEALADKESTFNTAIMADLAEQLKKIIANGTEVAIVVGGGNIMRGKFAAAMNLPRVEADKMGMLGTIINALALKGAFNNSGLKAEVQSAIEMDRVCELVNHQKALELMQQGTVIIYGGGTNNPYFSTDTCAALRACEIGCDAILMAKNNVDGVYNKDPKNNPDAVKYDELTYMDMLQQNLQVMDATASSLCMDQDIETIVFNMNNIENISKVINGEKLGTVIRR